MAGSQVARVDVIATVAAAAPVVAALSEELKRSHTQGLS